jgi:hypothetical protein
VKYLVKEGYIRFENLPQKSAKGQPLNPPDILIENSLQNLKYTLTAKGFAQLNKPIIYGPDKGESLYKKISAYIGNKAVDATLPSVAAMAASIFSG